MSQVLPDLPITISSQLDSYNSRVQLALYQWIQQSLNEGTGSFPGFAATAGQLTPGAAINGVNFTGAAPITVAAAAGTLTGNTLAAGVVNSSLTSVGTLANLNVTGTVAAGTLTGNFTGSAQSLNPGNTINGVNFTGAAPITVAAAAGTLTGSTLAAGVTASSLTSVGTLAGLTVTAPITGSVTGSSGSTTGNAATATALQTARAINGVNFNGTAPITVAAAAGTLTGATLAAGVTGSSLTSVSTLTALTVSGAITPSTTAGIVGTKLANNANAGSVGEYVTATGTAVSLTSGASANITSISLTPGDWDVWGNVFYTNPGTTVISAVNSGVSTSSASLPLVPFYSQGAGGSAGNNASASAPMQRINVASTTTVYLVSNQGFTTSALTATGVIQARRIR